MKDLHARLEKLRTDAEDCILISRLATDPVKRETFHMLAESYKVLAEKLERVIAARNTPDKP